ncbi:uncharacterized protein BT62DRAFT_1003961 [Guyanagaster necrorhizus]|uniref:Uncharacterized protein n=1 Tax=Guyanagaster necrorhizus TaxID=856835 RepID=A0A9P7VXB8_9AGAR|nr:uncharacterized protein BT62DRAFT_1003961 [Guyanagaster necrorhizus MCA 3950]KAG7448170.1 hypothetical protein BT62DRAFT_1003961 [Guyanagaster necrorhizus MCA 3950]
MFEVGSYHPEGDSSLSLNPRIRSPSLIHFAACDPSLIRSLELPTLQSMRLIRSGMADELEVLTSPDALSALHGMLSRSQRSLTLTCLVIHEAYIDMNLIGIMEISPQMTFLSLHVCNGRWSQASDETYRKLLSRTAETIADNRHNILPHLQFFYMDVTNNPHDGNITFVNRGFVEMVSSRWSKSPLKSVITILSTTPRIRLISPGMLSREDVQTLRQYQSAGLDIQVWADDDDSMDRRRYV